MEQISTLQASVDHQRIQQNSAQDRSSASLRHVQIRSSEQLDLAKETIAAKDQEVNLVYFTLHPHFPRTNKNKSTPCQIINMIKLSNLFLLLRPNRNPDRYLDLVI